MEVSIKFKILRVILSVVEESSVAKNAPDGWMFRQAQHDRWGVGVPPTIIHYYLSKKPLISGFFQVFFVFVRGGDNGLIIDVYHLPRVSVRFAFDVATSGVVHFDGVLLFEIVDRLQT